MKVEQNEFVYLIQEIKKNKYGLLVKAGKDWTENKVLKWEGVKIYLPLEAENFKQIKFAVLRIAKGKEYDTYDLELMSGKKVLPKNSEPDYGALNKGYKGEDGEIITTITVSKELLSKWTGLSAGDIERAFRDINLVETYSLMRLMPRIVALNRKQITIWREIGDKISGNWKLSIASKILERKHPIFD